MPEPVKLGRPFADRSQKARLIRVSITISAAQLEWLRRDGNTSADVRRPGQGGEKGRELNPQNHTPITRPSPFWSPNARPSFVWVSSGFAIWLPRNH